MSTIKLLGQEFGYPTTWHGAASIGFLAIAACVITGVVVWRDPTIFRALVKQSNEESINQVRILEAAVKSANEEIASLESRLTAGSEGITGELKLPSGAIDYSKWMLGPNSGDNAATLRSPVDHMASINNLSEQLEKSINRQRAITN